MESQIEVPGKPVIFRLYWDSQRNHRGFKPVSVEQIVFEL